MGIEHTGKENHKRGGDCQPRVQRVRQLSVLHSLSLASHNVRYCQRSMTSSAMTMTGITTLHTEYHKTPLG